MTCKGHSPADGGESAEGGLPGPLAGAGSDGEDDALPRRVSMTESRRSICSRSSTARSSFPFMANITKGRMNQRTVRKKPSIDSMTMKPPKISMKAPLSVYS